MAYWFTLFFDEAEDKYGSFAKVNAIFQVRCLRCLDLLSELQDFQTIIQTTKNVTAPILSKLLFLYGVYYFFAILGAIFYGGEITEQSVA